MPEPGPDASRPFAITYDYRCPFARVASRHVIDGLRSGARWEVTWVPFSMSQVHVAEDETPVWDRPDTDTGLLAQQVAVAVQHLAPDHFLDVHRELFDLRHVHGASLRDPAAIDALLERCDVDADTVWRAIGDGGPLDDVRKAHEGIASSHDVWGVPTFVSGESAAFVRLMDLPTDGDDACRTIDRILDLLIGWPQLNEFKHTSISR